MEISQGHYEFLRFKINHSPLEIAYETDSWVMMAQKLDQSKSELKEKSISNINRHNNPQ